MEPTKTVRFEMGKEDLIEFNEFHRRQSPSSRKGLLRMMLLLIGGGMALAALSFVKPGLTRLWITSILLMLLGLLLPLLYRRGARKFVDRMIAEGETRGMLRNLEVTLSPLEIGSAGSLRSIMVRWPAVGRIVTTGHGFYAYISSFEAIIVPRRAFGKSEEFEAFAATARQYQAEAAGRAK